MDFNEIGLKQAGFEGFRTVTDLLDAGVRREIPAGNGVYVVTYSGKQPPEFLKTSTGGCFKGKDPTFELDELRVRWIKLARVVYIGMTGDGPRAGLRTRIRALVRYGTGHNIGHAGGRALWQPLELTRFRGHPRVGAFKPRTGSPDAEFESAVSARVQG